MTACATNTELGLMLDGQVSRAQLLKLRAHIADCERCQQMLEQLTEDHGMPAVRSQSPTRAAIDREPALRRQMVALKQFRPPQETVAAASVKVKVRDVLEPPLQDGDRGSIGTYRVLGELGRGGMGVVFLGFDEELQRRVAIKVLRPDCLSPAMRARFLREARAAAGLQHKNVVPVYEVSESASGIPYLVMPVVNGQTVRQRIAVSGPLPPLAAARITQHVCDGLHAAHQAGMVHRDIKPDNIIVDQSGVALIMDFGLVRDAKDDLSVTAEGVIPGTPAYMSPEQILCPTAVGPASDIYSLGTTLFEMLTGHPAFKGRPQSVVGQVISAGLPEPQSCQVGIPPKLNDMCMRATHQDPQARYPSARALADDIRNWIREQPVKSASGRNRRRLPTAWFELRGIAVMGVSLCILMMSVIAFQSSEDSAPGQGAQHTEPELGLASRGFPGLAADRTGSSRGPGLEADQDTNPRQADVSDRIQLPGDEPGIAVAQPSNTANSLAKTQRLDQIRQVLEARIDRGQDTAAVRLELARVRIDLASNLRVAGQSVPASGMLQSATRAAGRIKAGGEGSDDAGLAESLAAVHFAIGQEYFRLEKLGYARESFERAQAVWKQAAAAQPGNNQHRVHLRTVTQKLQQIEREAAGRSQQDDLP